MSPEQQRAYVIRKARERTLADNDPHWQDVQRRSGRGVSADSSAEDKVAELGGASGGNVNKLI